MEQTQWVKILYPIPPGLNEQIRACRSHWSIGAKMKAQWTNICAIESANAPKFVGEVWVSFLWVVKNSGRDWDNTSAAAKFILDGLVKGGILSQDSMKIIQQPYIHFRRKPDRREKEGIILTIANTPIYEVKSLIPGIN
ncbi:MAG: hypothetical protein KME11_05010 [Timaviella obliquedivisa GSE-PSE-MK23-08B]|jgi:hypothetical protein|nr:hypothetical protein [Timaviella obliquedivisa GSE-PSE-MK23-08B]